MMIESCSALSVRVWTLRDVALLSLRNTPRNSNLTWYVSLSWGAQLAVRHRLREQAEAFIFLLLLCQNEAPDELSDQLCAPSEPVTLVKYTIKLHLFRYSTPLLISLWLHTPLLCPTCSCPLCDTEHTLKGSIVCCRADRAQCVTYIFTTRGQ